VHNAETFGTLEASLAALKEIIDAQRVQLRQVEHERDLLATGYKSATEKCEKLEALLDAANNSSASVRTTP
jgi:peptidoglycan hydrolase CwlO-like protein